MCHSLFLTLISFSLSFSSLSHTFHSVCHPLSFTLFSLSLSLSVLSHTFWLSSLSLFLSLTLFFSLLSLSLTLSLTLSLSLFLPYHTHPPHTHTHSHTPYPSTVIVPIQTYFIPSNKNCPCKSQAIYKQFTAKCWTLYLIPPTLQ